MKYLKRLGTLAGCAAISILLVVGLFLLSEKIIHHHNNFIRRFPHHVAYETAVIDLGVNSYYLAGVVGDTVYLGNTTTPLMMTAVNVNTREKKRHKIAIPRNLVPLRAPRIKVCKTAFFVFEGNVPYLFTGSVKDWKAHLRIQAGKHFSLLQPIDSLKLAIRFLKTDRGEGLPGIVNLAEPGHPQFNDSLLLSQGSPVFDTDGSLAVDQATNTVVYCYFYRNEFVVANADLELVYRGHTIDTVSAARLKIADLEDGRQTLAEPPLMVNRMIAADDGLLFVNSMLPGQLDDDALWKASSIIDVYDLRANTYRSSFPIYHVEGKKMREMLVQGQVIYVLAGNHLVRYGLRANLKAVLKSEK